MNESTPHPLLLPEILTQIFSFLRRPQYLYRCLLVSRLWYSQAEAQLYSDIAVNTLSKESDKLLLSALKLRHRRQFLRCVHWQFERGSEPLQSPLLDILLDCYHQPTSGNDDNDNNGNSNSDSRDSDNIDSDNRVSDSDCSDNQNRGRSQHLSMIPASALGPNRPAALKQLMFIGDGRCGPVLDSIMHHVKTLTTLSLCFSYYTGGPMYMVDLERILDSFPNLKALTIKGWMHEYFPATAAAEPEGLRNHDDNINSDTDEGTEPTTPYPLESFTFDQQFMGRTGPNAFTIFRRLSNLKKIWLQSLISEYICSQESRPWAFGRALKEYCPKIESIETQGPVAVWLFDLPILPPLSSSSSLSSEPPQYAPTTTLSETGVTPQLRQRLQEQEQEELLGGQNAAPFFPQLKKLVFRIDHTFSYQDLISLGVQAQFLTHLEFHQLSRRSLIFEMYERDAPFATASVPTSIADGKSMDYAYTEAKRLRKRHPFNLRDLMLFLQLCSSLRYFSLSGNGSNISIHDIFELTPDSEETTGRAQPFIRPWACEATLETLRIGLDLEDTRVLYQPKECHALVWKHLGRLCKLRSLSLFLSTLIPSFSYGVEGLLGGGCVGAMLQEIRHLPGWRQVEDRCEMVLWFAKSCPRLMVLGLVRMKGFVEEEKDEKGMKYTAFMEDEDVKQCSIHRIFVEEQELWGAYN